MAVFAYSQLISAPLVTVRSSGSSVGVAAPLWMTLMLTREPLGGGALTPVKSEPSSTWTRSPLPVTRSILGLPRVAAMVAAACSLPVQQLKIDQSFVTGIGRNSDDEAIIRTVMELATSLDFEVVAEGVETVEQAEFLAKLGCQQLQGYLHGKAVAPDEFRARWALLS